MRKLFLFIAVCLLFGGCEKEEIIPYVNFSSSVSNQTVKFNNLSSNGEYYLWDFGDGTTSREVSPTHTYKNGGAYNVILQASSITGNINSCTKEVYVPIQQPTANFTYTINNLSVSFSNKSKNANSYLWDFGDGKSSSEFSPTHQYASAGTYTVKLKVRSLAGYTDETSNQIAVKTPETAQPTANFSFKIQQPITVVCTNTSTNATSYL